MIKRLITPQFPFPFQFQFQFGFLLFNILKRKIQSRFLDSIVDIVDKQLVNYSLIF